MALLKIARMGHPVLLQMCEPVNDPGAPEIRRLVADMMETMEDASGRRPRRPAGACAVAAVRVPHLGRARASEDPDDMPVGNSVLINPEVELLGEERVLGWEGCLSIPGLRAAVPRAPRIRYRGVDCDGVRCEREVSGFHARVVQHEYDHLDGILYPMRMRDFSLFGFTEELARLATAIAMNPPERSSRTRRRDRGDAAERAVRRMDPQRAPSRPGAASADRRMTLICCSPAAPRT